MTKELPTCPECGNPFNEETRYNPSTGKADMPYVTYMHSYGFDELLSSNGKGICKHSIKEAIN